MRNLALLNAAVATVPSSECSKQVRGGRLWLLESVIAGNMAVLEYVGAKSALNRPDQDIIAKSSSPLR